MLRRIAPQRETPPSTESKTRGRADVKSTPRRGGFLIPGLCVFIALMLAWNGWLVQRIKVKAAARSNGAVAAAASAVVHPEPALAAEAAARAYQPPPVAVAPELSGSTVPASDDLGLVANEVIALRAWARNIADSNSRLASAYASIELPASSTAEETTAYAKINAEIQAAAKQSAIVGSAVEAAGERMILFSRHK